MSRTARPRTVRRWAAPLIALVLVLPLAQTASAGPSTPVLRRIPALFRSALHGRGAAPDIFSAKGITEPFNPEGYSVSFSFGDWSTDYGRWYVDIWSTQQGPKILIETQRDSSNSFARLQAQVYAWEAALPRSDVHFGKGLRSLSIHTGGDLAPFGALDLRLERATRPKTHTLRCHATGKKLAQETTRFGHLRGSISFTPGLSFLPKEVRAASALAVLQSVNKTKNHCPDHRCYPQETLQASDANGNIVFAGLPGGVIVFDHTDPPRGRVRTGSAIFALAGRTALRFDHGAITIDATGFGPLLQGSVTFVPGDTGSGTADPHCTTERDSYDGYGGTLSANLDSGTIDVHGSSMSGEFVKVRRTR